MAARVNPALDTVIPLATDNPPARLTVPVSTDSAVIAELAALMLIDVADTVGI